MSLEKKLEKALNSKRKETIEEVFEKIYYEYYKLVYFCVANFNFTKEDNEELTNDVFLKFYKNVNRMKINNIKYYLTTSAKNISLNKIRDEKIKMVDYIDNYANNISYNDPSFNLFLDDLKKSIDAEEYHLIVQHDVYGLTFKEIANLLNKPLNTISSKYLRAIKKIQTFYGGNDK